MTAAKYAHPSFDDTVMRYGHDARQLLEVFLELDELDQALVVLRVARFAPTFLAATMAGINEEPCFAGDCGHPRHLGSCEICGCEQ
jgi:hypothetical protein